MQMLLSPRVDARPAPPAGVTAAVGYLSPMVERPYSYMYEPPAGTARENCAYHVSPVWIADAREMAASPAIEAEGFVLCHAPSTVADFSDEDAVRGRYYAEAAELAKAVTGADEAYVFDHLLRQREAGRPALTFGRAGDGSRPAAVGRIHNDYSDASGLRRFAIVAAAQGAPAEVSRFAIVNIWRSIGGTIRDTPLALCDARTVGAADLVVSEVRYADRTGEIYMLQHSARHRWAYFSEMGNDEAVVFKQYDSQVSGVARFTPHAAFDLPDIPPDAPLRRSIEVRCLVTYNS